MIRNQSTVCPSEILRLKQQQRTASTQDNEYQPRAQPEPAMGPAQRRLDSRASRHYSNVSFDADKPYSLQLKPDHPKYHTHNNYLLENSFPQLPY